MSIAAALAIGLILGALGAWWLQREELRWLRKELATATDRLVHAWREDKAVVPPRPLEPVKLEPLPPPIQEEIAQWESTETRAQLEAEARGKLAEGWGAMAILKSWENRHP